MQMLFLDESGTAPKKGAKQRYFVIGGVIIPEMAWHNVEKELNTIKQDFNIYGEIKWRFFSPHNKDKDNSLAHLSFDEKNQVREKIYSIITTRRSIKIISVITSVAAAYDLQGITTQDQLYQFTYKPISERFQYFLQDLERDAGSRVNGIIVCDHRAPREDIRLQELHERLLHQDGVFSSTYGNLIEGLFIAPSHWSVGIQLADLVAGAVYRYFESGDDRYFNKIKNSFRKSGTGEIEGWGLIKAPKKNWR